MPIMKRSENDAVVCEKGKPGPRYGGMKALAFLVMAHSAAASPVIGSAFIYPEDGKPTPQCHASTIVEGKDGLVAAWFGGTKEGADDVGIWVSRHDGKGWGRPVEVAQGKDAGGKQVPCWNPVLFQPKTGPLLLFYKTGPQIRTWRTELRSSEDGGATWGDGRQLPDGICGPVKNKPVQLADGTLLCPTSDEPAKDRWLVHFSMSRDLGKTWTKTPALNDGEEFDAIQPTILTHPGGKLQALCRTREGVVSELWSEDQGKSWSKMVATELPNPNSGIDGVTLADGRHALVYNPVRKGRSPLVLGISTDGKSWKQVHTFEQELGEYSYPAIIQAKDGTIHVTYTWKRLLVKHVALDPAKLE